MKIKNIEFKNIILNASGPKCTNLDELQDIDKSLSGWVLSKSCTESERNGNEKHIYFGNKLGSINSMGLPNKGVDYYIKNSNNIVKPYFISVSGLSLDENLKIIEKILSSLNANKIDGLEINLSCPNVIGKCQLAYDFDHLDIYLNSIFTLTNKIIMSLNCDKHMKKITDLVIGLKLPPYFEISHFEILANIFNKYPIDYITCINSIGNGLIIDYIHETTTIKHKKGCGCIGGSYIKPTGLSNVWNFYNQFKKINSNIKIIGCGGISSGIDAFEYILCGASMVQIGTKFYKDGIDCFNKITYELNNLMKYKKYNNYDEFRGKLKTL